MEALILVATKGGSAMLARIGVMHALKRYVERVFEPSGKKHHWGKRKLARPMRPSRCGSRINPQRRQMASTPEIGNAIDDLHCRRILGELKNKVRRLTLHRMRFE
jgi:hypothetical protein